MSNLISITTKREADRDIVESLEDLLAKAKSGEITALSVAALVSNKIAYTDYMGPSDELAYVTTVLKARIDAYIVSLS